MEKHLPIEGETITLKEKKIILAEGNDDCSFLICLLNFFSIRGIQVVNCKGIKKLTAKIKMLKGVDGFDTVESILIVRDSEKSEDAAVDSINTSLRENDLISPKTNLKPFDFLQVNGLKIGFALWHDFGDTGEPLKRGTIEDVCLKVFREQSIVVDVSKYIDDFQNNHSRFTHEHKNKLHALFSFTNEFVGMQIKEASRAHGFDFTSPFLKSFVDMIKEL
jgi:hypothetical protein